MDEISRHLLSVEYPATREALIAAATASDAPLALITRLEALESDRYVNFAAVSEDLVLRRAESNSALVALNVETCELCGFSWMPGEAHSCVEEKARFTESVNTVTEEFERFDESTIRQAASDDLRTGDDRRVVDMTVDPADERRQPSPRRKPPSPSRLPTSEADQGGERREAW